MAENATVRVVKRNWDGSVSGLDTAFPLAVPGDSSSWLVLAGSRRERPASGAIEVVGSDDLDFEVTGGEVALQDEAQFHDHARTMGYPDQVVRGAWSDISTIAARYTNGDWPFDGTMQAWVDAYSGR